MRRVVVISRRAALVALDHPSFESVLPPLPSGGDL